MITMVIGVLFRMAIGTTMDDEDDEDGSSTERGHPLERARFALSLSLSLALSLSHTHTHTHAHTRTHTHTRTHLDEVLALAPEHALIEREPQLHPLLRFSEDQRLLSDRRPRILPAEPLGLEPAQPLVQPTLGEAEEIRLPLEPLGA